MNTGEIINWEGTEYTDAIGGLYREYNTYIYNLAYRKLGNNRLDAEEVSQNVWIAVIKGLRRFKGDSTIQTWITKIAMHKIVDYQRRKYSNPEFNCLDADGGVFGNTLADRGLTPEEETERREAINAIDKALHEIPDKYSRVLVMKYIQEMSAREVAEVFGKSQKSIESMIDRAKVVLRDRLMVV